MLLLNRCIQEPGAGDGPTSVVLNFLRNEPTTAEELLTEWNLDLSENYVSLFIKLQTCFVSALSSFSSRPSGCIAGSGSLLVEITMSMSAL